VTDIVRPFKDCETQVNIDTKISLRNGYSILAIFKGAELSGWATNSIKSEICRARAEGLLKKNEHRTSNADGFVKSPRIVMPDLIRHPEQAEFTGFRLLPE
jgi:hypothetical protein